MINQKFLIVIFFILAAAGLLGAEPINANKISLSLEKCLELVDKNSYEAEIAKIDIEKIDQQNLVAWFNYLPQVGYNMEGHYQATTGDYSSPANRNQYRYRARDSITFQQTIIDSNLISLIKNEENRKIRKEIIYNIFRVRMHSLVRNLYFSLLILKEQENFMNAMLEKMTTPEESAENELATLLALDEESTRLFFQTELAGIRTRIADYTASLLQKLHYPYHVELELTTGLNEIRLPDTKEALQQALANDVELKALTLTLLDEKDYLSRSGLNYLPTLEVFLDGQINERLQLGVNLGLHGSSFGASMKGQYLISDKDWLQDEEKKNETDNLPDREGKRFYIDIRCSFDLSRIYKNAAQQAILRNNIKKINLKITSLRDELGYRLKNSTAIITEYSGKLEFSKMKIALIEKEKQLLHSVKAKSEFEFIQYVKGTNGRLINEINLLFGQAYPLIYQEYADYFSIMEGGWFQTTQYN